VNRELFVPLNSCSPSRTFHRFVDRDMSMRYRGGGLGHTDPVQTARLPHRYRTPVAPHEFDKSEEEAELEHLSMIIPQENLPSSDDEMVDSEDQENSDFIDGSEKSTEELDSASSQADSDCESSVDSEASSFG
jgi:hypothetical protein